MSHHLPILALATAVLSLACSAGSDGRNPGAPAPGSSHSGAIVYTIGVSTDPYGSSKPGGFGVVVNPATAAEKKPEVRSRDLGSFAGAEWIGERRILVPRAAPPFRPPLIFRLDGGRLAREGPSPLSPLDAQQECSPDGKLVASQRIEPCEPNQRTRWECYRQADEIYLQRADGTGRREIATGHFNSWTPDRRLLVVGPRGARYYYTALGVFTGRRTLPLSPDLSLPQHG